MGDKGFDGPGDVQPGQQGNVERNPLRDEAFDPYPKKWNEVPQRDVPREFATPGVQVLPPEQNFNQSGLDATTAQMYQRKYGHPNPPIDPFTLALREANRGNRFAMELCTQAVLGGGQQFRVGTQPYFQTPGCFPGGQGDVYRHIPVPGGRQYPVPTNGGWDQGYDPGYNPGNQGPVFRDSNEEIYFPGGSTHRSETTVGRGGNNRDGQDPTRGMSAEDILVWSGAARNILEAVAILKGQNVPGGNGWPGGGRNQPWQSGQVWNQPGWNQGPSWNGSWDGNYPYDPGGYYPGGNNRGIVYNGNGDMSTRSSEMNFPGGSVYKDKTVVGGNAGRGSDYGHGQGHGHDGQGGITSEDILVGSGAVRNVLEGVAILKGRHPGANNGYFGNGGQQFSNNQARSYYDMQNLAQTSPDYRIRQRAAQQVARWQQRGMG